MLQLYHHQLSIGTKLPGAKLLCAFVLALACCYAQIPCDKSSLCPAASTKTIQNHVGTATFATGSAVSTAMNTTGAAAVVAGFAANITNGGFFHDSLNSTGSLLYTGYLSGGTVVGTGGSCLFTGTGGVTGSIPVVSVNTLGNPVTITNGGSGLTTPGTTMTLTGTGTGGATCTAGSVTVYQSLVSSFPNCSIIYKGNSTYAGVCIWIAPTTNSSYTVTFAESSSFPSVSVESWTGAFTGVDLTTGNGSSTSVTTLATGPFTPAHNGELCFTQLGYDAINSPTINSSFTTRDNNAFNSGTSVGSIDADFVQTTAAALTVTWTLPTTASQLTAAYLCAY